MRVVVSEFITLDGVIEDPGGAEGFVGGGWAFRFERGPEGDKFKLDELMEAEALLLGKTTYDGFAAAWPERTDDVGFADKMNGMPKFVVSSTIGEPSWNNTTVLGASFLEEIADLRDKPGGDILVAGSAMLVQALLAASLVDELRLMIFPTVLGSGKRLFAGAGEPISLRLTETKPSADVVLLRFER